MTLLRKAVDGLIDLSTAIGAAALILVALNILIDVVGRYFGAPLAGAQDISQMLMVLIVFGGMAVCDRNGGHVSMDVFEHWFPDRMNAWLDVLSALVGAAIFAGIAWTVYESSKISLMLNLATNIISLPKAWFQWALSAFAALTSLSMLLKAIRLALAPAGRAGEHTEEIL
ncbi:TRAP transporter small permease [Amorphus orientalis]|uniref:TRAP transporter small permease protein n=1 Tax=Amorphus orientalis TaxID=649198 RepID=A0AAE3VKW9_9HYPH|nr:TRAP transporter small permease [Amorphus orientalis]MDQ0314044.1 TRAP-type C4-dicarboxylate transport system permease small subunit [Amorphus orientalis]